VIEIADSAFGTDPEGHAHEYVLVAECDPIERAAVALGYAAERFMFASERGEFTREEMENDDGDWYTPSYVSEVRLSREGAWCYVDCKGEIPPSLRCTLLLILVEELVCAGITNCRIESPVDPDDTGRTVELAERDPLSTMTAPQRLQANGYYEPLTYGNAACYLRDALMGCMVVRGDPDGERLLDSWLAAVEGCLAVMGEQLSATADRHPEADRFQRAVKSAKKIADRLGILGHTEAEEVLRRVVDAAIEPAG
jgi:hypothetical protein